MRKESEKNSLIIDGGAQANEYNYYELIENVQDLIFVLDAKGYFIFVNRHIAELTNQSKEQWLGKDFTELLVPDDRAIARENFKRTLRGNSSSFEMCLPGPNGVIFFSTNMNPIFKGKNVIGVVAISRDISDRKKLEQEIIELKNFNESIIQSMQAGLITLDLNQVITSINTGAEEVLGLKASDVIGRQLEYILPSEQVENLLDKQNQSTNSFPSREMILDLRSGCQVHIGFTVTPRLDDQNERAGTIISFKDISQTKSMQAEMIRMDRLASLGVLASGIAHEIKNPLAGIKTMAQTLEEEMNTGDPRREYLSRIVRQVNRLDDLLKALFVYARPKPPVRRPYELQEIVREVESLVKQKLADKGIVLEQEYEANLPKVLVDAAQIQQVLINLMLNAIDAIATSGRIQLTARSLRTALQAIDRRGRQFPRTRQEALFVEMQLCDSGTGIEPQALKRIFDPFFTTKPQGTGLGLSMVYRIVAAHGGQIQAQSKLGEGTTFTMLLPTEE